MENLEDLILSALSIYKNPEIVADIIEFQRELNTDIDESFSLYLSKEGIKLACEKGCAYCCFGWEVKGSIPELILIVKALNSLNLEEKEEIYKKLERYREIIENKKYNEIPCPFLNLKENICKIYDDRPYICRLYVSENVEKCKMKEDIIFPKAVEEVTKNVITPSEEMISEEFKPLFSTKMSILAINYDKNKKLFYITIANTVKIYPYLENGKIQILIEKDKYLKKFGENF